MCGVGERGRWEGGLGQYHPQNNMNYLNICMICRSRCNCYLCDVNSKSGLYILDQNVASFKMNPLVLTYLID